MLTYDACRSVGVCLFELYTGKFMFTGRNNNEMLKQFMVSLSLPLPQSVTPPPPSPPFTNLAPMPLHTFSTLVLYFFRPPPSGDI